jgi:hypothetical protein
MTTTFTALDAARAYAAAGLSVIPVMANGTKRPAVKHWSPYQERRPTDNELARWFADGRLGVAVVGGRVSGGLEVLDFETADAFRVWSRVVAELLPGLLERLPRVRTPSGGAHVYYRLDASAGNTKLARDSAGETLIETRGEGGYVLAPGCPPACHETGGVYELVSDIGLDAVPKLSPDWREVLHDAARSLNEHVKPGLTWDAPPAEGNGHRPGDDFNRRADWEEILKPYGWVPVRRLGSVTFWRRPGKDGSCWSATTGHCKNERGEDLLYVFSSSASPFEPERCYSRFAAYALLNHSGDYKAAARALAGKGYGEQRKVQPSANGHGVHNVHQEGEATGPEREQVIPVLKQLCDVKAERVVWMWQYASAADNQAQYWLPGGALCILDGDPGLGKSTLTLDLAARVTRGWAMPPLGGVDVGRRPAGVLLLGAEDSLSKTVRPRLDGAGADVERVYSLEAVRVGAEERPPVLPWDLEVAAGMIRKLGIRLVVVDPLMAFLGGEYDAHKDQDIRRCLRPLSKLADELDVVILLLRHLNKLSGGAALYRGGGSIGITGAARAALIVGRDPDDPQTFVLAMNKPSLGPFPRSLTYRLVPACHPVVGSALRVEWTGETDLTAADVLWHAQGRSAGRPADALEESREWLTDLLSGGPVLIEQVRRAAQAELLSWGTLKRVKTELQVETTHTGRDYYWQLPGNGATCANAE